MNYAIMIAARFILATIAVATLSPFDNLPQATPQQTAAVAPESSDDGSAGDSSSDDSSSGDASYGGTSSSNIRGSWAPCEAPPR